MSISFIVLNTVTLAPLTSLLSGLMFSIKKERRYQRIMRKEQKDLVLARQKAEESDKLKTAFLSNMSHEIRTPMNAILGFSNLLSNKNINEQEKAEFTDLIRHNANNLMSLVEDIIDISKMESGQFEIRNAPCPLHKILTEVKNTFEKEIYRKGSAIEIILKKGFSNERLLILGDGDRLKKVLSNLLSNAIKFTETGYIEFGYTLNNEQELLFFVKDTGIGLPKGTEELIFKRFFKCNNNCDKLYGGTGIGLTIARHLVRYMGGDIWVEPSDDIGTTFCFTIPFQKVVSPINEKLRLWSSSSTNWEELTFLIADNNENSFKHLEIALSMFNVKLIWVKNGSKAIEAIKKGPKIDLIIMATDMPIMDGYEASSIIKRDFPKLPIIAQTNYGLEEEKSSASQYDAYISKPVNYNTLIKTIQKFIVGKTETSIHQTRYI